jgi:hypothetical protein
MIGARSIVSSFCWGEWGMCAARCCGKGYQRTMICLSLARQPVRGHFSRKWFRSHKKKSLLETGLQNEISLLNQNMYTEVCHNQERGRLLCSLWGISTSLALSTLSDPGLMQPGS